MDRVLQYARTGIQWVLLLLSGAGYAQKETELTPVTVKGYAPERFMSGLKVLVPDSALVDAYRFRTLADFLPIQVPVQFRSYGNGQLTTAGFRGTSASHTAVLWNGININQPTLGQTDFSTVSLAGFDQISVQYGGAASTLGTDAVGGSILLKSAPDWKQSGVGAFAGQRMDTFRNWQTQSGIRYATTNGSAPWRLSGKTHGYWGEINNRYDLTERRGYLLERSETHQRGFRQDIALITKRHHQLTAAIWLSDNKLTLSPEDTLGREVTRTRAYRFMTSYEAGTVTLRTAFIRDRFEYGKGRDYEQNPSRSLTDRFLIRPEKEFETRSGSDRQLTARLGGEWSYIWTRVDGYGVNLITEQRGDVYLLTRYQHNSRLTVSLNLRQAFVLRYDPPFTPSVGVTYRLVDKADARLDWRVNAGRSYRVPTLNERYWETLGNPNLRPERSTNAEMGLDYQRTISDYQTGSVGLTAYHNRIDDWVYWNPERGYRVENLQQVLARGLEVHTRWTYRSDVRQIGFFGQYALTRTTLERSYSTYAQAILGRQLVFIPLHTASAQLFYQQKNHRLTAIWQTSGRRFYTDDNTKFMKGYALINLIYEHSFRITTVRGKAFFQVDNVLNELYLNIKRNAMPGRSFALNLVLSID